MVDAHKQHTICWRSSASSDLETEDYLLGSAASSQNNLYIISEKAKVSQIPPQVHFNKRLCVYKRWSGIL